MFVFCSDISGDIDCHRLKNSLTMLLNIFKKFYELKIDLFERNALLFYASVLSVSLFSHSL